VNLHSIGQLVSRWPVARQPLIDPLGLGAAARSSRSAALRPRTERASRVTRSLCPYCAVGCGQLVYVEDEAITQIEGDPDSPISRGRLCPKGSATKSLVTGPRRERQVKYRPAGASSWQDLSLDVAMEMIADRVIEGRAHGWQDADAAGSPLRRTMAIGNLGGATLDNEENYLIKKLMTALGVVQVENQARI
jgi:formate dehydrogenase major subunit